MHNIELLMAALAYIEQHLSDEIKTEDIAGSCFCSKSTLEKLFRKAQHISVHDYIVRRRMMLAAKKISQNPQTAILDIAIEYGYSTHESFARAFEQVWNCKPSEFRQTKFTELFPRRNAPREEGENMIPRTSVDISELYDLFQERRDCFAEDLSIHKRSSAHRSDRQYPSRPPSPKPSAWQAAAVRCPQY